MGIEARLTQLEARQRRKAGDFAAWLKTASDEELADLIERDSAGMPPDERARKRAWIESLSDDALERLIAGGQP
jgi:hypothetical protein